MHEHKIVEYLGMHFHLDTIYMSILSSLIVLLLAFLATRNLQIIPKGRLQNVVEMIVEAWLDQLDNNIGPKGRMVAPLIITLFLFLLIANWVGLVPGLASPTNDINCALGLALVVVLVPQTGSPRLAGNDPTQEEPALARDGAAPSGPIMGARPPQAAARVPAR